MSIRYSSDSFSVVYVERSNMGSINFDFSLGWMASNFTEYIYDEEIEEDFLEILNLS